MRDWPGVLLTATIWTYWLGVAIMIARVRRSTHRLAGLVPEQRVEQTMWLIWVPLVAAWLTLPYLSLVRAHPPLALPDFARLVSGYAILRNSEGNPQNAADFRASVSVFYEILTDGRVTDTVSVPVGQPTLRWTVPVEIDAPKSLYSGLALVNLASTSNTVTLKLWNSYPPFDGDASDGGTATITLPPREQRARFLIEQGLFPDKVNFKGVLVGTAEKPVAVLGLLQTSTPGGVQYSTLAAEYLDALVTESSVYLPDGMVLDADVPRVPYVTRDDSGSSDFLYQFISTTVRYLVPQNGATFASLGRLSANEFNNLTIEDLQSRSYSATTIDVSDFTGNLAVGLSIAIRTSLGRVAKVRVAQIVVGSVSKDLALQVYVYR